MKEVRVLNSDLEWVLVGSNNQGAQVAEEDNELDGFDFDGEDELNPWDMVVLWMLYLSVATTIVFTAYLTWLGAHV